MQIAHAFRAITLALAFSASTQAATILSITGAPDGSSSIGGTTPQYLAIGWQQTAGFNNVSISAAIGTTNPANDQITAYLLDQIGPGTTAADEITSGIVTLPVVSDFNTIPAYTTIFSGLTLPSGNYFLVLTSPLDDNSKHWSRVDPAATTISTDLSISNVTSSYDGYGADPTYAPASTFIASSFFKAFEVTDGVATPEPGTIALLICGSVALFLRRRH